MSDLSLYDDDESFCEGDPHPDDINWSKVAKLQERQDEVLALPDDTRSLEMAALLVEMYGDDLEVL